MDKEIYTEKNKQEVYKICETQTAKFEHVTKHDFYCLYHMIGQLANEIGGRMDQKKNDNNENEIIKETPDSLMKELKELRRENKRLYEEILEVKHFVISLVDFKISSKEMSDFLKDAGKALITISKKEKRSLLSERFKNFNKKKNNVSNQSESL